MSAPMFSVIMATYGRGQHIAPSIASVMRQSFTDFELIVVSDGPAAEEQALGVLFPAGKISWHALAVQSGSQAAPNNHGIGLAGGTYIAYIGHDDIWSAAHLQCLADTFGGGQAPEVAVSGCLYHGPPGTGIRYVTGLIDPRDGAAKFQHFFPPSSVAHRKDILRVTGPWRDPRMIAAPDDADFMLRAAHAGLHFGSTGRATVHKFAAGHRYLSYLCQDSREQAEMLGNGRLDDPGAWAPEIARAQQDDCYMVMRHPDYSTIEPGALFALNRSNKGLERAALTQLGGVRMLRQGGEVRALDWYGLEPSDPPFRWSGPNPRPKILIPFSHSGRARIILRLPPGCEVPRGLEIFCCGRRLKARLAQGAKGAAVTVHTRLNPQWYTVLELYTPVMEAFSASDQKLRRGIAISDITITPAPSVWRWAARFALATRRWVRRTARQRRFV